MRFSKYENVIFFAVIFFTLAIFLILIYIFHPDPILDEGFHLESIKSIGTIISSRDFGLYFDSNPPFSPFLLYIAGLFTGQNLHVYRLIIAVLSFFNLAIFYGIAKQEKVDSRYLAVLMFFFSPYYIFLSVTLHYEIIGLFFGLLALKYFLRFTDAFGRHLYLGSLFSFLAIWSVTRLVFLPVGFVFYIIVKELLANRGFGTKCKRIIGFTFLPFLSLLTLMPLFIRWGGIIPPLLPRIRPIVVHTIGANFSQVTFFLIFLGFYFFIHILANYKNFFNRKYALAALGIPFCLFFAQNIPNHGDMLFSGVIARIVYESETLMPILSIFFFLSGMIILIDLFAGESGKRLLQNKLFYFLVSFILMMITSRYIWERYYLLCLPIVILMVYARVNFSKLKYYYGWLIGQFGISGIYFIYKISH